MSKTQNESIQQSLQRIEDYLRQLRDAVVGNPHEHPLSIQLPPQYTHIFPDASPIVGPGKDDYGRNRLSFDAPPLPMEAIPLPPARAPGSLHVSGTNGELPDSAGTPGATNPAVTDDPAVLKATIGTPGWTATVRPPVSYTNALKIQVMREYGLTGDPASYELDHLVPLCCGGHPISQANLWAQRRDGINGASTKDITESWAQHAILSGLMTLADVRAGFQTDWTQLHARMATNPKLMSLIMMAAIEPIEPEP